MEIQNAVPPLQLEGLQGEEATRQIGIYVETQIARMQEEIFALRQFLEPAIINNKNSPDQQFNPLE